MTTRSLTGAVALGFAGVGAPAAQTNDPEARRSLVGVWRGFPAEGRGQQPDRGPVKLERRINEREIAGLEFKGTNLVDHGKAGYQLDLSPNPPVLEAAQTKVRGRIQQSLSTDSLDGDTLTWCVTLRKSRPAQCRTGDGCFLLILKRPKP